MSRKRKVRFDRVIILFLCFLILCGSIYFLITFLIDKNNKENKDVEIIDSQPVTTNEDIKVSLVDYDVYIDDSDSLGFNFIIAQLNFKSSKAISFDLSNLQTSEKIYLNNISKYLNTLQEKGYNISKLEYVNNVVSDSNDYTCKLFIPFTTDSYSLRLLNTLDTSMITIDLNSNKQDITALKFETDQKIEVGNTNVTVSSCSISTMMLHNGEEYPVSSTLNVYTFRISVSETEDNIRIVDAVFLGVNDSDGIHCLDETYESEKVRNCINKNLVIGDNGALFFETAIAGDSPNYDGFLMLKFSNSDDWVKISTSLE